MDNKTPELKPCPFCGDPLTVNKAKMVAHSNYDNSECPLFTRGFPADHDASVKAWNRRADLHVKVKPLEFRDSYGVIRADTPFGSYKIAGKILHLPNGASMVSENPEVEANERHREFILAALEPAPMTPAQAAEVLLNAMSNGLNAFDPDGDNELEGLAVKWSGNRGDGVMQLEIAEEFMRESLRAIAEGESE